MALTDKLTAIGDAIREKTETTELLTLDGMAAAIAGIEAGGGEGIDVMYGTVTITENTKTVEIENKLGRTPKFIMFAELGTAASKMISNNRKKLSLMIMTEWAKENPIREKNYGLIGEANESQYYVYWYTYGSAYNKNSYLTANDKIIIFGGGDMNTVYEMDAGDSYLYIVIG